MTLAVFLLLFFFPLAVFSHLSFNLPTTGMNSSFHVLELKPLSLCHGRCSVVHYMFVLLCLEAAKHSSQTLICIIIDIPIMTSWLLSNGALTLDPPKNTFTFT